MDSTNTHSLYVVPFQWHRLVCYRWHQRQPELGDGFNIYSLIVCSAIPVRQRGVLQVASTSTRCTETIQARWDPQSKGFLPREILHCEDVPFKYRIGSSKFVIEFFVKSKYFMLGNTCIIPASIDLILLSSSHKTVKRSYTVSFSRHVPLHRLSGLTRISRFPDVMPVHLLKEWMLVNSN